MRTANLVLLLVAVGLSAATLGCGGSSDAAIAPDTTSDGYVSRTDFKAYVFEDKKAWKEAHLRLDYLRTEQDKIKETVKKHDDQLTHLAGSSATPISATLTSLGAQPTVRGGLGSSTPAGTALTLTFALTAPPGRTASPGVASYDLPPHLAAYVKERFDASDAKQTEILGKEDTIIGKLNEVATAVNGLTGRIAKIEQRLPATNPPVRPKPAVPQPE